MKPYALAMFPCTRSIWRRWFIRSSNSRELTWKGRMLKCGAMMHRMIAGSPLGQRISVSANSPLLHERTKLFHADLELGDRSAWKRVGVHDVRRILIMPQAEKVPKFVSSGESSAWGGVMQKPSGIRCGAAAYPEIDDTAT